jgi:DNA-binding NarL/FixJ family response regulator
VAASPDVPDGKEGAGSAVELEPVALSIAAVSAERGPAPREGQDPLSRVVQLRTSLRENVVHMRSQRRELQQQSSELKVRRRALHAAFDELKELLPNDGNGAIAPAESPGPVSSNRILELLSPQQRRVLEGVLAGRPNKEIAFALGISTKTVETHRARVMVKLEVESLAELVRICTIAGIC